MTEEVGTLITDKRLPCVSDHFKFPLASNGVYITIVIYVPKGGGPNPLKVAHLQDKGEGIIDTLSTQCREETNQEMLTSHTFPLWEFDTWLDMKYMKSQIHRGRLIKAESICPVHELEKRTKRREKSKEKPLKIKVWSRQQPRESKRQYKSKNTMNQHSHYNANRTKLNK